MRQSPPICSKYLPRYSTGRPRSLTGVVSGGFGALPWVAALASGAALLMAGALRALEWAQIFLASSRLKLSKVCPLSSEGLPM